MPATQEISNESDDDNDDMDWPGSAYDDTETCRVLHDCKYDEGEELVTEGGGEYQRENDPPKPNLNNDETPEHPQPHPFSVIKDSKEVKQLQQQIQKQGSKDKNLHYSHQHLSSNPIQHEYPHRALLHPEKRTIDVVHLFAIPSNLHAHHHALHNHPISLKYKIRNTFARQIEDEGYEGGRASFPKNHQRTPIPLHLFPPTGMTLTVLTTPAFRRNGIRKGKHKNFHNILKDILRF
jgi:hypothetical protein